MTVGGLVLANYRGTAEALLGAQQVVARRFPIFIGPPPSKGLNAVIAVVFIVMGAAIAVGGPFLS